MFPASLRLFFVSLIRFLTKFCFASFAAISGEALVRLKRRLFAKWVISGLSWYFSTKSVRLSTISPFTRALIMFSLVLSLLRRAFDASKALVTILALFERFFRHSTRFLGMSCFTASSKTVVFRAWGVLISWLMFPRAPVKSLSLRLRRPFSARTLSSSLSSCDIRWEIEAMAPFLRIDGMVFSRRAKLLRISRDSQALIGS